jgi:hypothetical protein
MLSSYEFVDPQSGEIKSLETKVDIDLIQEYNEWVIEGKLNPPDYSPIEFAKFVQTRERLKALDRGLEMLDFYAKENTSWSPELLQSLVRILRNEE